MAKLSRKTQKIFASNSAQNQVSTFGSIKAGAVAYSKDVSNIQTEAFEGGWSSAVQDDYAPYRQDRNAVDFVTTSQLAYVFQEGLPEYDAGTTYYKGSWVKGLDGDSLAIYESLKDDNIGNSLDDEESWEAKSFGGGLEIGDIGIAPLGINEAQNKRRYLNGQVISQAQFVSFTNKLKDIVRTYPSLATSETNWQATVTNSKLGQCGKFVIDDTLGTIRLPKVVNINGLQDLALMGSIKAESLPNITGNSGTMSGTTTGGTSGQNQFGALSIEKGASSNGATHSSASGNVPYAVTLNASNSSSTYQDNAPVQQEAVQYPYFIQVATGVEESVDVTREIELNNPFSLLDYKWSEYELNNASWLLSNGAFHSGATYVAVYELLLKIHNGTETKDGVSVKLSTEAYEDTDFVINTVDTTFRLPIKVANAPMGGVAPVKLIKNGTVTTAQTGTNADYGLTSAIYTNAPSASKATIEWETDLSQATNDKLKLYFYVGETVQDANVIAASGVLNQLSGSSKLFDGQWIANYKVLSTATGVNEYTLDLSDYLPNDGYMYEVMVSTYLSRIDDSGTNTYMTIYNTSIGIDGSDTGEGKTNSFMNDAVDGANMQQSGGGCVVIVGADRTLNCGIRQHKLTAFALNAVAYRRIGTNR